MAPRQVVQWLRQEYPRPVVSQEWLDACCEWVENELHIDPHSQVAKFIYEVETQLLNSNFSESMVGSTGFPQDAMSLNDVKLQTPVLAEITSVMEIGHSAFNLYNTRQMRIERADLSGLAAEEETVNDEGPIPNYPRSMLSFELFDGSVTMKAIEYKPLPQLKLEETPLGYKIQIKNALIRRGILFLEPNVVVLKGHKTEDRDTFRDRHFLHGLYTRLGKPIPVDEDDRENRNENFNEMLPVSASGDSTDVHNTNDNDRAPFRELPEPSETDVNLQQDTDLPRKRRVPNPTAPASSLTLVDSPLFEGSEQTVRTQSCMAASSSIHALSRMLSPVRGAPISFEDLSSESDEDLPRNQSTTAAGKRRGSPPTQRRDFSSTYEIDLTSDVEFDDSFLAQLDEAEREAREGSRPAPPVTEQPAPNSMFHSQPESTSAMLVQHDIITIDDDDGNDKENVPVAARRVRRRISDLLDNVIDLSD